ncbi:MAG: AI-2E family transporter, partial [Candidatus Eisenbacteria bacterium]
MAGAGPYHWLERQLGGRSVAAAVLFTVFALIVLIKPTVFLTSAIVDWGQGVAAQIRDGQLAIPPAPESVRSWPVVGSPIYEFWSLADSNLQAALLKAREPLQNFGLWLLHSAATAGAVVLQFALSVVVAGVLLANSDGSKGLVDRFAVRLAPESGRHMRAL